MNPAPSEVYVQPRFRRISPLEIYGDGYTPPSAHAQDLAARQRVDEASRLAVLHANAASISNQAMHLYGCCDANFNRSYDEYTPDMHHRDGFGARYGTYDTLAAMRSVDRGSQLAKAHAGYVWVGANKMNISPSTADTTQRIVFSWGYGRALALLLLGPALWWFGAQAFTFNRQAE